VFKATTDLNNNTTCRSYLDPSNLRIARMFSFNIWYITCEI